MDKSDCKARVRLLLVGPVPPPYGGIATYVNDLYQSNMENVDFYVFNTSFPEWVAGFNREGGRTYLSLFEGGLLAGLRKLFYVMLSYIFFIRAIIDTKPDIVQVFPASYWAYWRNWVYLLIAKILRKKTIFHVLNAIDAFYNEVGSLQKCILRLSLKSPDFILVQSPYLQKFVEQLTPRSVKGLFNGIHIDKIPSRVEKREIFDNSRIPIGVTVGNLSKNKGTYLILDALNNLKREGYKINWNFIGRGNESIFEKLATDLGIRDQVHFSGVVDDSQKWEYLSSSDFFCLPSIAEGQPISIIEAMAVGLPIISTKVGSIPEIIVDGKNGYLIEAGNVVELQNTIKKMAQDLEIRKEMGKNNIALCEERHNIYALLNNLRNVYLSLSES